jgi:hypothetical protein
LASKIAWRNEPEPLSLVLVTEKTLAWDGTAGSTRLREKREATKDLVVIINLLMEGSAVHRFLAALS